MPQRTKLQAEVPERVQVFARRVGCGLPRGDYQKGAQFGCSKGCRRIPTGGRDAIGPGADGGTLSPTSGSRQSTPRSG